MHDPQDRPAFLLAMKRLSTVSTLDLTGERVATCGDALCALPIESVLGASQHAARYWRPTPHERFPAPLTVREYAAAYREQRKQHAAREAEKRLPQWSTTPDGVGLTAIRDILRSLGEDMTMRHPVYQHPSLDD